jgi:O-acetyl-ADP-ribose deacetylase (regulator of RNase III)
MPYTIRIRQGNLMEEPNATFIVNASNTKLMLGSGVSMAFKRHCGLELQYEMDAIRDARNDTIRPSEVVRTSPGRATNFRYALHAAIMNYHLRMRDPARHPTLDTITNTLHNIEQYILAYRSQENETIKLVLPLMGCGVGGLDKTDVIRLYRDFFSRDVEVACTVAIYGYSREDYALLKEMHTLLRITVSMLTW